MDLLDFGMEIQVQAKIDFLKWYLSVNSSEIYGKFRVFGPKKIKKIDFSLYILFNIIKTRIVIITNVSSNLLILA
jgi:hypothetical protein